MGCFLLWLPRDRGKVRIHRGFPGDTVVKNRLPLQEAWVLSLDQEDPLEKGMATHSSILAWRTPWTEKSGRPWGRAHTHSHTHTESVKERESTQEKGARQGDKSGRARTDLGSSQLSCWWNSAAATRWTSSSAAVQLGPEYTDALLDYCLWHCSY